MYIWEQHTGIMEQTESSMQVSAHRVWKSFSTLDGAYIRVTVSWQVDVLDQQLDVLGGKVVAGGGIHVLSLCR